MMAHRQLLVPLAVVATLSLVASWRPLDARAATETLAEQVLAATPGCPEAAERCFALRLHVAEDADGTPVVDARWLLAQVEHANDVFADVAVGFEIDAVLPTNAKYERVLTRRDRDRLGRTSHDRRLIDVFVVAQLANVDDPGDIRGVHWRDRAKRSDRWIILSAIAPPPVLAHELGHYFGVPHTTAPKSIMNKTGSDPTPFAERRFAPAEQRRITASAKRFAKARAPVDRRAKRR